MKHWGRLKTFSDIPVIVFSAHSSSREKALALGADDFVAKPFTPEQMAKKISEVLQLRAQRINPDSHKMVDGLPLTGAEMKYL